MLSTILLYILMLIIPSVMLIYGLSSWYSALNNRSTFLTYRSKKAKKNDQTWVEANLFFGKLMSILGFVLFVTVILLLWYLGTIEALTGFAETVMLLVEVIVFLGVFYLTEMMLNKKSDGK